MRLVGTKVMAENLGVTPQTVRNWADRGLIPYRKVGATYRFDPVEVDECLRAQDGPVDDDELRRMFREGVASLGVQ